MPSHELNLSTSFFRVSLNPLCCWLKIVVIGDLGALASWYLLIFTFSGPQKVCHQLPYDLAPSLRFKSDL
ncbi:hypothetical protein P692DRAFT_20828679 [Suillus brevipes Sb2]|nr:hypothetical protein P692DRAFT_20828679 [Suillus brevipes Sb2]